MPCEHYLPKRQNIFLIGRSVNETTDSKKPHHVVSLKVPLATPCSIHTGRTQKQRSSSIVCAGRGRHVGKCE